MVDRRPWKKRGATPANIHKAVEDGRLLSLLPYPTKALPQGFGDRGGHALTSFTGQLACQFVSFRIFDI